MSLDQIRPQEFADDETRYASSSHTPSTLADDDGSQSPHPPSPTTLNTKLAQLTETRLPNIDQVSLELHRALHHFRPITEDYSSEPYHESFNWDDLELPENMEGEWYCVAFRSRRKANSDDHCKCITISVSLLCTVLRVLVQMWIVILVTYG